jgi:hypothetical protein
MVTVVTLVDNRIVETYVGVVQGSLTEEERAALAVSFDAVYGEEPEDDDWEGREICFREVEVAGSAALLQDVLNCSDGGMGGVVRRSP